MILKLMPCRYEDIKYAIDGYIKTGVFGIEYRNGEYNILSNGADDQGLYLFAQILYKFFNLSVDQIVDLFHFIFLGFALIFYCLGFWFILKTKRGKLFAFIELIFSFFLAYKYGDVYILFLFTSSFVPIFIYSIRHQNKYYKYFICFFFATVGFISNLIRSHSFTGVLIFIISFILFSNLPKSAKAYTLLSVIIPFITLNIIYKNFQDTRNSLLLKLNSNAIIRTKHVFWHSVYIGLGFVDNPQIPRYLDEVAIETVRKIDPDIKYLSDEYEKILMMETIKLVKRYPLLVFLNLGAKFGVILLYFIIFANIGIIALYLSPEKDYPFLFSIILGILFNSLFGFLVVPLPQYLLGFISLSAIFGIYYTDLYLTLRKNR